MLELLCDFEPPEKRLSHHVGQSRATQHAWSLIGTDPDIDAVEPEWAEI